MGTAGIVGYVLADGQRKGSYNHHDSYAMTTGRLIEEFLRDFRPEEIPLMARRIEEIKWVDGEELADDTTAEQYRLLRFHDAPMFGLSECCSEPQRSSTGTGHSFEGLLRGFLSHCAHSLQFIKEGKLRHLIDYDDRAGSWLWYIDFHQMTVWVESYFSDMEFNDKISFEYILDHPSFFVGYEDRARAWITEEYGEGSSENSAGISEGDDDDESSGDDHGGDIPSLDEDDVDASE